MTANLRKILEEKEINVEDNCKISAHSINTCFLFSLVSVRFNCIIEDLTFKLDFIFSRCVRILIIPNYV